jgi:Uma2 family endonuclease
MPQGKHSTIQGRLTAEINRVGVVRRTSYAFPELRCTFANRSIVLDIAVFTWERIPRNIDGEVENAFTTHPDWVIAILAPDQSQTRVVGNVLFCLNQGTSLGWLVDPEEKTVMVFRPGQQPEWFEETSSRLPVLSVLEDWQLTLGEMFGWLSF